MDPPEENLVVLAESASASTSTSTSALAGVGDASTQGASTQVTSIEGASSTHGVSAEVAATYAASPSSSQDDSYLDLSSQETSYVDASSPDTSYEDAASLQGASIEIAPTEIASTEIAPTEIASTEIGLTQVALTQVASSQVSSPQVASPRVASPHRLGHASYFSQHGSQFGSPYGIDTAPYNSYAFPHAFPYVPPYGPPYNFNAAMDNPQNPSRPIRQQSEAEEAESIRAFVQYRKNNPSKFPVPAQPVQPPVQPPAPQSPVDQIVAPIEKLSVRPRKNSAVVIPYAFENFHKFSEFPAELRLKIWRRALPLFSNLIRIGGCSREGLAHFPVFHVNIRHSTSGFVPVRTFGAHTLLCVNKESRKELLKYYPAPFNSSTLKHRYGETFESIRLSVVDLRVNLEYDTFFFYDSDSILPHSKPFPFLELFTCLFGADKEEGIRQSIRRIALAEEVLTDMLRVEDATITSNAATSGPSTNTPQLTPYKLLQEFGKLEEITIVAKKFEQNYLFNGFKEVEDGTGGKLAENLKRKLDARVNAREDLTECDTRVVQIKQKYFSSKLTRENMAEQIAASMARRCSLPANQRPPYMPKRQGGKVDDSPGWK